MSTLPGEPSRRGNGIEAEAYVLLRSVDRDLAPVLLDALREAEIAAYTTTGGPSAVAHDLWVASEAAGEARRIAARVHRERSRIDLAPEDIDELFAELVAGFDQPSDVPDRPSAPSAVAEPPAAPEPDRPSTWRGPSSEISSLDDPPDDPDDHFVPPPVQPLRRPGARAIVGIALIAIGCAVLFFPSVLSLGSTAALVLGVLGIGSGVGILILGLRSDRDDDLDDGAVV